MNDGREEPPTQRTIGIGLVFVSDLAGIAWLLPLGVVVSSLSDFLRNASCLLSGAFAPGLVILIW